MKKEKKREWGAWPENKNSQNCFAQLLKMLSSSDLSENRLIEMLSLELDVLKNYLWKISNDKKNAETSTMTIPALLPGQG